MRRKALWVVSRSLYVLLNAFVVFSAAALGPVHGPIHL